MAPGWVLKVSNAAEDPGVVEMEVAAVEHVARMDPALPVPRARPTTGGDLVGSLADGTLDAPGAVASLPAR